MLLSVVTPTGVTPTGSPTLPTDLVVDEVTLPGALGEFGVLAGHTPFMSALKPGRLRWRSGSQWTEMQIGEGFAEVSGPPNSAPGIVGDKIIVLTRSVA